MRIRKKKWARPELEQCEFFLKEPTSCKGKWQERFGNHHPIYIELGCGKGNFISHFAANHPEINFIAIDLKDDMLGYVRRNIKQAYGDRTVQNIILVPYDIERIGDVFAKGDAATIERLYIHFCNPWPKARHRKKRLTHTRQLENYKMFLKPGAQIHFKTDDEGLYQDTIQYFLESGFQIIFQTEDLPEEEENIITEHEKMFRAQGIKIKKIIAVWGGK